MGKDITESTLATTEHRGAAFQLMIALSHHSFDQNFTGWVSQRTLMATARLKPDSFRRAQLEIECSREVLWYERPGKPCVYFMQWAYLSHETDAGRIPDIPLEWPEPFKRLGRSCPRPTRKVWTEEHNDRVSFLHQVTTKRREMDRARKTR